MKSNADKAGGSDILTPGNDPGIRLLTRDEYRILMPKAVANPKLLEQRDAVTLVKMLFKREELEWLRTQLHTSR